MQLGDASAGERAKRSQLDEALNVLDNALDGLVDTIESGGLDQLSAAEKISFWQRFEAFRNRLPVIDHTLIADAEAHDLAGECCFSSLSLLLTRLLLLSPSEAASRVRAAAAVGPGTTKDGEQAGPALPDLAAAQRAGAVSPEQVQIVVRATEKLSRADLNLDVVKTAEQQLAQEAQLHGPKELRLLASRIVDAIDPDRPELLDDRRQQDRRHVELRQRRDGMWQLHGTLTNTVGAQLHAVLDPLTRPRSSTIDIDGTRQEIPDGRRYGQRMHDGLEEACSRLLRLADRPATGGTPASVIVTIGVEDLLAKAGIAETSDGSQLSSDQLLRIADEAEIWPSVIDRNGVPLALGRTRRIASRGQTMALIAREGGCSFPGCDHPPQWCDRHHIIDWIDGGPTDLANLTLLCRYHHTHFLQKGWSCRSNTDGLPEWIPPRWIDPEQRPQLHNRIQRLQTQRDLDRRRQAPAAA
jgi:hypothetical protein